MSKKKTSKKVEKKVESQAKLVEMIRGDKVAKVHPDEVDNYALGGYKEK